MAPDRKLPEPGTATELYLAALVDEVKQLRAEVQALRPQPPAELPPEGGTVELKEPASIRLKQPKPKD